MTKQTAPCGGCPPSCGACVFSSKPKPAPEEARTVLTSEEYGCVHGGSVVHDGRTLGLLRADGFRELTIEGSAFLKETRNPLHKLAA
jgi:hypothetical protein